MVWTVAPIHALARVVQKMPRAKAVSTVTWVTIAVGRAVGLTMKTLRRMMTAAVPGFTATNPPENALCLAAKAMPIALPTNSVMPQRSSVQPGAEMMTHARGNKRAI